MNTIARSLLRPSISQIRNFSLNPAKYGYVYVNDKDPSMEWSDLTERAANAMFWTEIVRGIHF